MAAVFGVAVAATFPAATAVATSYYVAPTGNDAAAGTMAAPWATVAHAQALAAPGDTVYFRGGRYGFSAGTAACASETDTINGVVLSKSGVEGRLIEYRGYPGEKPIFDFSGIKDSCRVRGFAVTGSWLHLAGFAVTGVPQNNNLNHESWGVWVSGSNNVFELLDLHHNMGPGLFIQDGGGNLVLNCDSHENYDPMTANGAGQSADGFGCHVSTGGTGNVFRGCRSWWNSDDGWDFIHAAEVVTVENSWSWYNGFLPGTMTPAPAGNGNGFKAGGFDVPETKVPAIPPSHVVRNCLAFSNKASGFYANHEPAADRFYNNTAYANHPDFDLLGMLPDGTVLNLGVLRNNLAYGGTLVADATGPMVDASHDSWDLTPAVTVSDVDFLSTSMAGMDGPRQADGSLPCVPFMRLAPGSALVDKGVDVGLPFRGAAPDIGAFELGPCAGGSGGAAGNGGGAGSTAGAGGGGAYAGGADGQGQAGGPGSGGGVTATGGSPATGGWSDAMGGGGGEGGTGTGGDPPGGSGGTPTANGTGGDMQSGGSGGGVGGASGKGGASGAMTAKAGGCGCGVSGAPAMSSLLVWIVGATLWGLSGRRRRRTSRVR